MNKKLKNNEHRQKNAIQNIKFKKGTDLNNGENNYEMKNPKSSFNHFDGINSGFNIKRLKNNKKKKINEQAKNSESARRGLIIDKNFIK